eukprot:TRINITY_DN549_c0_g1_i2.p1 TRINITY_DN549_c0_g1~~TRINITY_DN549_c0_g1_i2.p1  ORF type:complete len:143 (+),score=21.21 TRINITY_DN549_c0_g1_i2:64-492(+)
MKKGSLQSYLQAHQDVNNNNLVSICQSISSGMTHLSNYHIFHNDLAARNILVEEFFSQSPNSTSSVEVIAKITDFGLASGRSSKRLQTIPIRWSSPEVMKRTSPVNEKTDVWSFGVLIYEVFTFCSHLPYRNLSMVKLLTGF